MTTHNGYWLMRYLIVAALGLMMITGCGQNTSRDHYFCNDLASEQEYRDCIEAGEKIERAQEKDLPDASY